MNQQTSTRNAHRLCLMIMAAGVTNCADCLRAQEAPDTLVFEEHVRPIFATHCFGCHGTKQKAELDLRSGPAILRGSESGSVLSLGRPEKSLLYEVVQERRMPPEGQKALSSAEQETIQRWELSGAKFRKSGTSVKEPVSQHVILPILKLRCATCHGRQTQHASLDLRTRDSILKGGKSGPAMVIGQPHNSQILKRIHADEMPPRDKLAAVSVKPMTDIEVELLTQWIAAGAPEHSVSPDVADTNPDPLVSDEDRSFWSFQSPNASALPTIATADSTEHPVDAFVLRKLREHGLTVCGEADRRTLIRRATFDLTGLPPTPDQIADFLTDKSSDAYEQLIDRLLKSPRYGERWGRYWLDLAGYADSEGGQHADRVRPEAYRYRDYVIRSLNADKPYDQFLVEQIAGDELIDFRNAKNISDEIYDNLVATGFLRMAPDGTYAGITAFVPDRLEIIDDELEVLTSSVMGLTLRCARCHSHKFDPIPQRDYYRLAAIFKGALDEHDWLEPTNQRYVTHVSTQERREWQANEDKLTAEVQAVQTELAAKQREFAKKHADVKPNSEMLRKLEPEFDRASSEADEATKAINKRRVPEPRVRALWDRGEPSPTYILKRGNYLTPGRPVGPGVPSVLTDGKTPFDVVPPFANTTGRRLALARWLTQPKHPLTARVMVNRIWKHHFGKGIVSTLDNFGTTGARPTHPELLDWLATEFIRLKWSIKSMHRLLMTSATYRQSSEITDLHTAHDPENKLLTRMPLRRMDGEVLRDCLLSIAGRLDLTPHGEPDAVAARDDGLVVAVGKNNMWRRTIYVQQRRTERLTILDNFDLPQLNPNCIERSDSIVAPQALHLLNNRRIHELSRFFAARVRDEAGTDAAAQIHRACVLATGRPPAVDELQIMLQVYEELNQQWLQQGVETTIPATTHLWVRHSEPDRVYEEDLISVWSRGRELRSGLVEFDVSGVANSTWTSARLELGILNTDAIRQTACLVPPGIDQLTWNGYQETKFRERQMFQSFGRIEALSGVGTVGHYARSAAASAADLRHLNRAGQSGRITLALIADEDGTAYGRDWDDGSKKDNIPRLIIRHGTSDSDEAAQHALQNICHALMNSADFLYID
ncbi:MAG: DUF1553 domain-containing protein [Fuerstiella sp.]|nr:DUF1553 domain-containing protein [Fuerstiella sp.]